MMLPFVFINVATTADGKLAPASRHFVPFGSRRDQKLLLDLRATADAVMAGARTVDLSPVGLGPGGAKYRRLRLRRGLAEYNLRVVVSGSASLNPDAAIFKQRFSPIIVLATHAAPKRNLQRLAKVADEIKLFGTMDLDFHAALTWLREERKVRRLLCEGGGEINEALFEAGLVNEVHQTLCPLIFGGRHAPTMADGRGVQTIEAAPRLRLQSLKRFGSELFLVYRVIRSGANKRSAQAASR
jgi:riboflavin-specific deaminase-like protein